MITIISALFSTYQSKLNAGHDPLDGKAGDEDEDGQDHQAQVQADGLQAWPSHGEKLLTYNQFMQPYTHDCLQSADSQPNVSAA